MRKHIFSLLIASLSFYFVEAQNVAKLENLANEYFRIEEYHHALPLYLQLDSISPNNGAYNYAIGKCYMQSDYKTKAIPYFEKTLTIGGSPLDIYYDLGICYHLTHDFDNAIRYYNKALNRVPESVLDIEKYKKDIIKAVNSCEYAKTLVENPIDMKIENIGNSINSKFPDYVPVISADETTIIFTARRENTTGGLVDETDGYFFEDVYISHKEGDSWGPSENIGTVINTDNHDACVGLSPDGQKLFLYRSGEKEHNGQPTGDLYVSDWDGTAWSAPVALPEGVNSKGREPSASISSDENTLFFSSSREGGKGGLDIYWVKKLPDGSWAAPKPINEINTEYDEDAPFIHSDNRTLYFSSRGHLGMGGYDIFRTIYDESTETWSEPINMGYPINTAGEDIYFVWSADGKRGYFSSYREDSYGEKDIYIVNVPQEGSTFAVLKGIILDKETKKPIIANVKVTNKQTSKMVGFYTSSADGKFTAIIPQKSDFKLLTGTKGYLAANDSVSIPEITGYYEKNITIYLEKGEDDIVVAIDSVKEEPKVGVKFVLNNIYFDFDKATLRPESVTELNKILDIMTKYTSIKIEVGAHTDAWGTDEYNMELSKERAKSVVEYLVSKSINRDRLVDKAYGESKPVAPSNKPYNSQKNRRIEFKVIGN